MKKSRIAILIVFFILIPLTIWLCSKIPGRGYYVGATAIIAELLIPFFLAFEGRRPQARELVLIAVMCALAVAGRAAIPIPNFKAAFAIILISGIAFGPETGFTVGAVCALVSNFFYGQGAYLPWQMMAYGAGGMLAGFAFRKGRIPRKPLPMALFGFFCVVLLIGPLLDTSTVFLASSEISFDAFAAVFASGAVVNLIQGACTAAIMFIFGRPLLDKLERAMLKYGMTEVGNGL